MSRFTTELRFMLESQAGLQSAGAASDVNTVINDTRTWLFDFSYPCSTLTEAEKEHLEKNFMLQNYNREIGFETFGLFKNRLQAKLWMIMPKYEKLYALEHENLDFFDDVDYYKTTQGDTNKRTGSVEHQNSGKDTTITTGGYSDTNSGALTDVKTGKVKETTGGSDTKTTNGKYKDTTSGNDMILNSDTPQNEVDITASAAYISQAQKNIKGSAVEREYTNLTEQMSAGQYRETEYQNEQNVSTDTRSATRNYSNLKNENENNKKLVDTFNNLLDTVNLTEHTYGNMGDNLDKFIKYRDNILNLERMIIDECNDLFMLMYM